MQIKEYLFRLWLVVISYSEWQCTNCFFFSVMNFQIESIYYWKHSDGREWMWLLTFQLWGANLSTPLSVHVVCSSVTPTRCVCSWNGEINLAVLPWNCCFTVTYPPQFSFPHSSSLNSAVLIQQWRMLILNCCPCRYVTMSDNEKTSFKARELKSVHIDAVGQYLRLVLHKNYINKFNLYNQVLWKSPWMSVSKLNTVESIFQKLNIFFWGVEGEGISVLSVVSSCE